MFNLETLVKPNIQLLKPYSSARDEYEGSKGIFLDANENPFGSLNRYPDPFQKKLKKRLGKIKNLAFENIFIGNGSDEVIDLALRIFCRPATDNIIIFPPTYGMYETLAGINDTGIIRIPLNQEFQINYALLKAAIALENIKIIFICSPNNPTGNIIHDIGVILSEFKGIVFIDEAYIDFCNQNSWVNRVNEFPNLIVSQTFSKAWGLAAARVGVAYASRDVIALFNKIKPPYNVSTLNQKAAIQGLKNSERYKTKIKSILKEKERLIKNLRSLSCILTIYPSDANFILVQFTDADKIYKALIKEKIITRNRSSLISECIRITIGTKNENTRLIKSLNKMYA